MKTKLTQLTIRYRYLLRLVFTTALFVFLPVLILFGLVISRIYTNLYTVQHDALKNYAAQTGKRFETAISNAYTLSAQIGVDSKDTTNEASILQPVLFSQNNYYLSECVRAVSNYSTTNKEFIGLYYPESDVLFTKYAKYNLEDFFQFYLKVDKSVFLQQSKGLSMQLKSSLNFFRVNTSQFTTLYLLAVPTKIGAAKANAICLFQLSTDFINETYSNALGSDALQFCVLNNDFTQLLYDTYGNLSAPLFTESDFGSLKESINVIKQNDTHNFTVYTKESASYPFFFVAFMQTDRIARSVKDSISVFIILVAIFSLLLLLLLMTMVHINYLPIRKILQTVKKERSKDEIAFIQETLYALKNESSEKDLMLMDSLLSNVLYGVPIPARQSEQLGLTSHTGSYCVYMIVGQTFTTQERHALTTHLHQIFQTKAFMTDILYQSHTVIICLLNESNTKSIHTYLAETLSPQATIFAGKVVRKSDEIGASYKSCITQKSAVSEKAHASSTDTDKKNKDAPHCPCTPPTHLFRQQVEQYVKDNCGNALMSQVMVADHFGISIYSLSRLFNNEIGIGFSDYVASIRLELAKKMLLTTDCSIAEIATTVGIQNVNYFSRLFKTRCSITPSYFREKERGLL